MARLDTNGEPSMEEILASIRKIIAEEPPGSRPAPGYGRATGTPAAGHAASPRGFMARESFLRSSGPEAPAPYLGTPSGRTGDASDRSEPSLSFERTRSESEADKSSLFPQLDDIRAKLSNASALFTAKPDASASAPAPQATTPTSGAIEAQLNDLLSDFANDASGSSTFGTAAPADGVSSPRVTDAEPPAPSRAGAEDSSASTHIAASDPFAFDLGPSPLALKRARLAQEEKPEVEASPAVESKTTGAEGPKTSDAAADGGATFPSDVPAADLLPPKPEIVGAPTAELPDAPAAAAFSAADDPVPEAEPKIDRASPEAAPVEAGLVFVSPSVGATMDPSPAAVSNHEQVDERAPVAPRPVKPFDDMPFADLARRVGSAQQRTETRQSTELTTARSVALAADDSMEDAVADLLRPLLRTWLAENMPRIVERALRREMLENFDQRKSAAE